MNNTVLIKQRGRFLAVAIGWRKPRMGQSLLTSAATMVGMLLLLAGAAGQAQTNELGRLVQQGLFEEEANQNLDAAAKAYREVVSQFDKDRTLAATAIFRLGEVYRKQGKTNEANAMYERIVREFSDQAKLAHLSRQLAGTAIWTPGDYADPQKVLDEAKADAAAGRYRIALAKHVWYFENALKYNQSYSGVRLSFALSEWMSLAAVYPPALEKLKSIRDEIEKSLREGEAWRDPFSPFMDFRGINRALRDPKGTTQLFAWLDATKPSAAATVYPLAEDALIETKEFALCGKYVSAESFDTILRNYRTSNQFAAGGERFREHNKVSFINSTVTLVALLSVNKRAAEAEQVVTKALKELDTPDFRERLARAQKGEFPAPLSYAAITDPVSSTRAASIELFNGRDLTGWSGNPEHWSVRDGAITGTLSNDFPAHSVSALIWQGVNFSDFELRFRVKFTDLLAGSALVEYRGTKRKDSDVRGYNCSLTASGVNTGFLSARDRVGLMSYVAKTVAEAFQNRDKLTKIGDLSTTPAMIVAAWKKGDWNDCTIIARGNHLIHQVNGQTVADLLDNNENERKLSGLLAFVLNKAPVEVQFKDIRLTKLSPTDSSAIATPQSASAPSEQLRSIPTRTFRLQPGAPEAGGPQP